MASKSNVAHNWAHQLKAHLTNGSNFCFKGSRIFSYNTVIGQYLKCANGNVLYLLNDLTCSSSTSKHQAEMKSAIPSNANVFPLIPHTGAFCYGWKGMYNWGEDDTNFPESEQMAWISRFCKSLLIELLEFKSSKSLENETKCGVFENFALIKKFCQVTGYATIPQLIRKPCKEWPFAAGSKGEMPIIRKLLVALSQDVKLPELVDIACGKGAYEAYVQRTKGPRRTAYARKINQFLGYDTGGRGWPVFYSPYLFAYKRKQKHSTFPKNLDVWLQHDLHASIPGSLSIKAIDAIRKEGDYVRFLFETRRKHLEILEKKFHVNQRAHRRELAKQKLECYLNLRNARKLSNSYPVSYSYNGTTLDLLPLHRTYDIEWPTVSEEEYNEFVTLEGEAKQAWIERKRAAIFADFQNLLRECEERAQQYDRMVAERKAQEQADKKLLEELKARGDEGIREAYHQGLLHKIPSGISISLFCGGNTLMRFNEKKQMVETSKGMWVKVEECERLWKLISRWHNNETEFRVGEQAITYGYRQGWRISRYSNDIMTAGCHSIAYCEMENIAKTLGFAV